MAWKLCSKDKLSHKTVPKKKAIYSLWVALELIVHCTIYIVTSVTVRSLFRCKWRKQMHLFLGVTWKEEHVALVILLWSFWNIQCTTVIKSTTSHNLLFQFFFSEKLSTSFYVHVHNFYQFLKITKKFIYFFELNLFLISLTCQSENLVLSTAVWDLVFTCWNSCLLNWWLEALIYIVTWNTHNSTHPGEKVPEPLFNAYFMKNKRE